MKKAIIRHYCVELITQLDNKDKISTLYYFKHALKAYQVFLSFDVKDQPVYLYEVLEEGTIKSFRLLEQGGHNND